MTPYLQNIKSLYAHRDLLFTWTYRIIRGRYQQSILGGLWAIIVPTATAVIFSVIFTFFVPVNTGGIPYIVFSYTAMVPWTLFSSSIGDMADSLVGNMNLVSKIYFPREILPIASFLARLVDATIAFLLLVFLMVYFKIQINVGNLFILPFILVIQLCLSLGLGFIGSALNVFYRDVRHIIVLVLQIWFYASPIIYPVSSVPEALRPVYFINPMVGILESYRIILLYRGLPDINVLISAAVSVVVLLVGYWLFKRVEFQFADVI